MSSSQSFPHESKSMEFNKMPYEVLCKTAPLLMKGDLVKQNIFCFTRLTDLNAFLITCCLEVD